MTLRAGGRLGPYEIVSPLGQGGMGEVYRARDPRLGRDVALKVLPDLVARDKERLARFEREAKLLASLAHPNIAAVHALEEIDGRPVLVMELAPGEDLSVRVDRGPIPIDETLPIAIQIASAFEAAHEKGIVHRDLKPSNVKLGADGAVKVLDFGLAKAFGPETAESSSAMDSPTLTAQATAAGVILGTAAYMSPEQARGRTADKRADIWAFGVVLHEMLTGTRLFQGETISDTLAAVLRQEIDFSALPTGTPTELTRLLRRCLERDRRNRLHDLADARIVLQEIARGDGAASPPAVVTRSLSAKWAVFALVALAALGAGAMLGRLSTGRSTAGPDTAPTFFTVSAPQGVTLVNRAAISADGSFVVFRGFTGTRTDLYIQRLNEFTARRLDRTEGASGPFISPDGRWIGFHRNNALEKISTDGGDPLPLASSNPFGTGVLWARGDRLILQPSWVSGLAALEPGAGTPHGLTTADASRRERAHWFPRPLPGGQHVLFTIMNRASGVNDAAVAVLDLATGVPRVILENAFDACYLPPGYLLFLRAGSYHAIRFDIRTQTVAGDPIRVLDDARGILPDGEMSALTVSDTGTLAYVFGPRLPETRLTWVADGGKLEELPFPARVYTDLSLSKDGRMAAAGMIESGRYLLRMLNLDRGTDPVLDLPGSNWSASWHPDGRHLAIQSLRKGDYDLYIKDLASNEPPAEFLVTDFDDQLLAFVPPDGKSLIVSQSTEDGRYPVYLVGFPDRTKRKTLSEKTVDLVSPSPDGRWLAVVRARGRQEVYVRPLFKDGPEEPVSARGGQAVAWLPRTHELLYARPPEILAVAYREDDGRFVPLRERVFARVDGIDPDDIFDVGPDGRVLVSIPTTPPAPAQIRVIIGFDRELERKFKAAGR